MPYISPHRREELDGVVGKVASTMQTFGFTSAGDMNYVITKLINSVLLDTVSYQNINEAVGVLECSKMELYRRVAVPYEDQKKQLNGDVYQ